MIRCGHCKRELPESEFYPSHLKRGQHTCKKCHNAWSVAYQKKYPQILKKQEERIEETAFDNLFGGYTVVILNSIRPGEHKYIIKNTNGYLLSTNNVQEFRKKLNEIIG